MPLASIIPMLYILGVGMTALIGGRLSREEADTPFIALSALLWPLAVPCFLALAGTMQIVRTVQNLGH